MERSVRVVLEVMLAEKVPLIASPARQILLRSMKDLRVLVLQEVNGVGRRQKQDPAYLALQELTNPASCQSVISARLRRLL